MRITDNLDKKLNGGAQRPKDTTNGCDSNKVTQSQNSAIGVKYNIKERSK